MGCSHKIQSVYFKPVLFSFIEEKRTKRGTLSEVLGVSISAEIDKGRCPFEPHELLKKLDQNFFLRSYSFFLLFGTGSSPPAENGLQRMTRHRARSVPRRMPHSRTASRAYCEQVGVNRQHGTGLRGERNFLYSLTGRIQISHKSPCAFSKILLFFRIGSILRQRICRGFFFSFLCVHVRHIGHRILLFGFFPGFSPWDEHIECAQAVGEVAETLLH